MPTLLGLLESLLCWQITVLLSGSGPLWPFVATLQVRPFGPFGRLEFGLSPSTESAGLQAAFSSGGYLGECCFRLIISIVTSTSMDCDDYCLRLLLLLLLATPPPRLPTIWRLNPSSSSSSSTKRPLQKMQGLRPLSVTAAEVVHAHLP